MNELKKVLDQGFGFATYPSVKIKDFKKNKKGVLKFSFVEEVVFGDYLKPLIADEDFELELKKKKYIKIAARETVGYIPKYEIQPNRIMEVNFVDVGQGDGCHLVTPEDEHFIIDAGQTDNMFRFLKWRFNLKSTHDSFPKFTAVVTHPDQDHYRGFTKLFTSQNGLKSKIDFDKVLHNGIVEESGTETDTLGTIITDNEGNKYVTDICFTNVDFENRAASAENPGRYIRMLQTTSSPKKAVKFGDKPIYDEKGTRLEILGPIVKTINGKEVLPVFDENKGRTKNGHSVILKLTIGKLRILLGGDLNSTSEEYLFQHFTKTNVGEQKEILENADSSEEDKKVASDKINKAILKLRKVFGIDIAKSCHHGSADFTNEFLAALNPIATIISSGDRESHCHPRPDTLGTLGKYSRGERSLIFSTELARSTKEFLELSKLSKSKRKEKLVIVYGMITVRTDGKKTLIAQKLEKPRSSSNWDINELIWNEKTSEFEYLID